MDGDVEPLEGDWPKEQGRVHQLFLLIQIQNTDFHSRNIMAINGNAEVDPYVCKRE
jgi:hypothetical protein